MFPVFTNFLVIDDSIPARALIKSYLSVSDYKNVFEAGTGKEALDVLEKLRNMGINVHVIIADWNMPTMSGLDMLKKLKDDPFLKGIPFLMVTSESESEQVVKAISAGVTDYIVKPFTEEVFMAKLAQVWARIQKK